MCGAVLTEPGLRCSGWAVTQREQLLLAWCFGPRFPAADRQVTASSPGRATPENGAAVILTQSFGVGERCPEGQSQLMGMEAGGARLLSQLHSPPRTPLCPRAGLALLGAVARLPPCVPWLCLPSFWAPFCPQQPLTLCYEAVPVLLTP